ncbi:MAG: hypothetical protein ACXW36_07285, partial [Nitrospira sp.]
MVIGGPLAVLRGTGALERRPPLYVGDAAAGLAVTPYNEYGRSSRSAPIPGRRPGRVSETCCGQHESFVRAVGCHPIRRRFRFLLATAGTDGTPKCRI